MRRPDRFRGQRQSGRNLRHPQTINSFQSIPPLGSRQGPILGGRVKETLVGRGDVRQKGNDMGLQGGAGCEVD